MLIDREKIIQETLLVFKHTEKFRNITDFIDQFQYSEIHRNFLTATDIFIDCDQFSNDIERYNDYFQPWGNKHNDLPRYGLALVNQDGTLKTDDPINGSLHEWNIKHPDNIIIETDCREPTDVLSAASLLPLNIFNGHWCRSNILKWHRGAKFYPHIDTCIPSPWIRLWATNDAEKINLRYMDEQGVMQSVPNIENGRVYVIDTAVVHDAECHDTVYQLFLSVTPQAINILKERLCIT